MANHEYSTRHQAKTNNRNSCCCSDCPKCGVKGCFSGFFSLTKALLICYLGSFSTENVPAVLFDIHVLCKFLLTPVKISLQFSITTPLRTLWINSSSHKRWVYASAWGVIFTCVVGSCALSEQIGLLSLWRGRCLSVWRCLFLDPTCTALNGIIKKKTKNMILLQCTIYVWVRECVCVCVCKSGTVNKIKVIQTDFSLQTLNWGLPCSPSSPVLQLPVSTFWISERARWLQNTVPSLSLHSSRLSSTHTARSF